jgi:hypothetical protein
MNLQRSIAGLFALIGLPALTGCAIVDQYSGRAITYNLEAEQAQDQALLLNVVRAYLEMPMQFTSVSTITGAASASGSVGYTTPVDIPFRPITNGSSIASFPALKSWSFGGGMSGGPTFTVPVLDTQEFYQGIMKPIPGQLYDLYNQGEYPRSLLLALFVQKVVMTLNTPYCLQREAANKRTGEAKTAKSQDRKAPPGDTEKSRGKTSKSQDQKPQSASECEFVFHNSVDDDLELDLFQALADYLMWLGFSTESTPTKDNFFKDVTDKTNKKSIQGLEIKVSGVSLSGGSSSGGSSGGSSDSGASGSSSGGETGSKDFGFCFSPRNPEAGVYVPEEVFWCKNVRPEGNNDSNSAASNGQKSGDNGISFNEAKEQARIKPSGSATGLIKVSEKFIDRLIQIAQSPAINHANPGLGRDLVHFRREPEVYLTFTLRSTEALIYFLGEIARRQLAPTNNESPRVVLIRQLPTRYNIYPAYEPCVWPSDTCKPLFVLEKNAVPRPDQPMSVIYAGNRYSIPGSPRAGTSLFVLEIVKQLLALNSSAKALPQSNVISLVGQ